jgi:hypothetical protein
MTEEGMFPFRVIFALISIAAVAAVIVIFIWLFVNTVIKVHESVIDRAAIQLSNVLANSKLTISTAVFNQSMLDYYNDPSRSMQEPFAKHCSYGYRLKIESLTNNNKWEFGYDPEASEILDTATVELPVSIYDDKDNVINAKMTLTLYDTWTTRIACLIDKAYNSGMIQKMGVPCLGSQSGFGGCAIGIGLSDGNKICLNFPYSDFYNCRYWYEGIPLRADAEIYYETDNKKIIEAIPIKTGLVPPFSDDCTSFTPDMVSTGPDDVGTVILCVGVD